MKKLAIYGAGGFGREMALMISQINQKKAAWDLIGFYDDGIEPGTLVDDLKVLGNAELLNKVREPLSICIAIAEPRLRFQVFRNITNENILFPVLVHPNALTGSESNTFGQGCIVTAGVILTTGINLGEFCLVNFASTVGHDVTLENFCTVMPGCSISGNVLIGSKTVLGTGSRIIQGVTIGKNCLIGAGSVVTKSFPESKKIVGVPARSI